MTRASLDMVDRLTKLARDAEPPPLDDLAAHRIVERAMNRAAADARPALFPASRARGRWMFAATAAAVAVAVVIALFARRPEPEPELLRIALPTGDRLVGIDGARFDIDELTPASRKFRVHDGTMLFDVAHVVPDQHVQVTTPDTVIVATGTVFSVATSRATTDVHVYEGSVDITHAGARHELSAGESWSSSKTLSTDPTRLAAAARDAIRERAAVAASAPAPRDVVVAAPRLAPPPVAPPPPPAAPTVVPVTPKPPRESLDKLLASAREHVRANDFDAALADVRRARDRNARGAAWWIVEGDALRGLGRLAEAAAAFEEAAPMLAGSSRMEAAYSAAYLRFRELADPGRALSVIETSGVDDEGSPLEERGLALRVQVLDALARPADAAVAAKRYLVRFPRAGLAEYMKKIAARATPP